MTMLVLRVGEPRTYSPGLLTAGLLAAGLPNRRTPNRPLWVGARSGLAVPGRRPQPARLFPPGTTRAEDRATVLAPAVAGRHFSPEVTEEHHHQHGHQQHGGRQSRPPAPCPPPPAVRAGRAGGPGSSPGPGTQPRPRRPRPPPPAPAPRLRSADPAAGGGTATIRSSDGGGASSAFSRLKIRNMAARCGSHFASSRNGLERPVSSGDRIICHTPGRGGQRSRCYSGRTPRRSPRPGDLRDLGIGRQDRGVEGRAARPVIISRADVPAPEIGDRPFRPVRAAGPADAEPP